MHNFERNVLLSAATIFAVVFVLSTGCGQAPRTASSLAAGQRVSVAVSAQGLEAQGIAAEPQAAEAEGPDEAGGPDCRDGLDAAGQPCDGGPAMNATAEGTDGEGSAAGALGSDEIVLPAGADGEALGVRFEGAARPVGGGAVRYLGRLAGHDRFVAVEANPSNAKLIRLVGRLEKVTKADADTVVLRVLGRDVVARKSLALNESESVETAGENEKDGVDCQQEGEHQGNNDGCTSAAPTPPAPATP